MGGMAQHLARLVAARRFPFYASRPSDAAALDREIRSCAAHIIGGF